MADIGKRIMKRRQELGLTQEELAKMMGYKSKSTINKIELGINDVSQSKIVKFSDVLCVSVAYLMGWENEEPVPVEERELLRLFRSMNKAGQAQAIVFVSVLANSPEYIKNSPDQTVEGIA